MWVKHKERSIRALNRLKAESSNSPAHENSKSRAIALRANAAQFSQRMQGETKCSGVCAAEILKFLKNESREQQFARA